MSRQANPRIVGGFVLGALVLAVAAVVVFGAYEFRPDKVKGVVYFDGSVGGLGPGSPVLFRGARIGQVTGVVVRIDVATQEPSIPVFFEIDRNSIEVVGGARGAPGAGIPALVERGLRAKLVSQSMITGQLAIMLDFLPDVPVKLRHPEPDLVELPSAPSMQEQLNALFQQFKELPIGDLLADMRQAVQGINAFVRSEDLKKTVLSLNETLDQFRKLAVNVDGRIEPITKNLDSTLAEARAALQQARESIAAVESRLQDPLDNAGFLIKNLNTKIDPLTENLQKALQQADSTLATAEKTLAPDSATIYRLNKALDELSAALESITALSDYLERHPDSVFKGKSSPGGMP